MDWTEIALAGIGGGAGALIGSVLAALFARSASGRQSVLGTALVVIGAIAGARLGPTLLDDVIGDPIRSVLSDNVGASIDELFASNDLFVALAEADPAAADRMRLVVEEAYIAGGEDAAREAARREGEQLGFTAVITYGPRSPDAELIAFQTAVLDVGRYLSATPEHCYGMFYRELFPELASDPRFNSDDQEPVAILSGPMAAMIRASGPEVIQPDFDHVVLAQSALQTMLTERYADNGMQFLLGQMPDSTAEYELACTLMLDILDFQLNHEYAADSIRAGLMQGS